MSNLFRYFAKFNPFALQGKWFSGHERTVRINRHVVATGLLQGINVVVGLLLVPMIIHYVNPTQYGIWVTLGSIVSWVAVFDLGLGNGLRNKLTEALARNDQTLARAYVSTAYASLLIIVGGVYFIFLMIRPLVDWAKVLNAPASLSDELMLLVLLVFSFFSLQFVLRLIINMLYADQRPAWNSLVNVSSNILALVLLLVLTLTTRGSLVYLGAVMSGLPVLVLSVVSVLHFRGRFCKLKPSLKSVDFAYCGNLMGLGLRFFIIQLFGLIIFSTDYIIISQLYGPAEATPYNIAFKYFGLVSVVFISVVLTPYWSAYTDAYTKDDFVWIRQETTKLLRLWSVLFIVVTIMVALSSVVYQIWIGDVVQVPFELSVFMGLFVLVFTLNSIFAGFINGAGKVQLRMYAVTFAGLLNIPLSIFLAKGLQMGLSGVIFATTLCIMLDTILCIIQYRRLVAKTASGVWNR